MRCISTAILMFCVVLFGQADASFAAGSGEQEIRVAIFKDVPSVTIQGDGLRIFTSNRSGASDKPLSNIVIAPGTKGLSVNGKAMPVDKLAVSSVSNITVINGTRHRGAILVSQSSPATLLVVNSLHIEDYLHGLMFGEIAPTWPKEAIKAQAVAARTYALFKRAELKAKNSPQLYDVESTVSDQVYNGAQEDPRVFAAINETTGEVLKKDSGLVKTYYHSTCAGMTEVSRNVWGDDNGIPSVNDQFCRRSHHMNWRFSVSRKALTSALQTMGHPAKKIIDIKANYVPDNPRARSLTITTDKETFEVPVNRFRELLGFKNLKSAWFTIKPHRREIVFNGHGFGHGVGMCQWGARGMAEAGRSYQDILKAFYPGTVIEKIY